MDGWVDGYTYVRMYHISLNNGPSVYYLYSLLTPGLKLRQALILSASERSERAQSLFMSIEISDIYIYIYMWPYVNLYAHAREIIAKKRP